MGKQILILGAGWSGNPIAQHFQTHNFNVDLITRADLSRLQIKPYDLIISSWPSHAESCFHTLPTDIPILAMSSTSESPEQLAFESFLQQRFPLLTLLRLGGLIGYNRHPGKFLSGKKGLKGALHPTNLLHRDDLIQIVTKLAQLEKLPTETLNAVCDEHPSRGIFYPEASRDLDLPLPEFDQSDLSTKLPVSNSRLKELINYTFLFPTPFDYLKVLRERKHYDS